MNLSIWNYIKIGYTYHNFDLFFTKKKIVIEKTYIFLNLGTFITIFVNS